MSLVAILGDLHCGARKNCEWTQNNQKKFFEEIFFPYIKKHKIETIIQTGDFFDERRSIRHSTMQFVREKLIDNNLDWHVLVGNHDMMLKHTIHPNSADELLSHHKNFTVYNNITTIEIDGLNIDMIPWLCDSNESEIMSFIDTSKSHVAVGHFELSGFKYMKGVQSEGIDANFLQGYHKVISGHFHSHSENDVVNYIGTPYQLSFNDADEDKGFWVLDTDTQEMEFIKSELYHYTKAVYGECDDYDFTNKRVRLHTDVDDDKFQMFVSNISDDCDGLDIVYNIDLNVSIEDAENIDVEDTRTMVATTIDNLNLDKSDREGIMKKYDSLFEDASDI